MIMMNGDKGFAETMHFIYVLLLHKLCTSPVLLECLFFCYKLLSLATQNQKQHIFLLQTSIDQN